MMRSLRILSLIGLVIYFAVLLFAVTRERKNHTVIDYFFAGRTLPFWALSVTFIASWWGAGSALSTADLAYSDGLGAFWYYGVPVLLSTFCMTVGAKAIRRVPYYTQGQMMEKRYSKETSRALSVLILLFMTVTAASQMVGIGDFFGTYLGLRYETAVLVGTAVVLIYSMFGGFRGVVLTDIIQFVLLLLSALVIFGAAFYHAGGIEGIRSAAAAQGKADFLNFGAGAKKYVVYILTFGFAWTIQANVWQRISAARNEGEARKMTTLSFIVFIPLYLLIVLTGMSGVALYPKLPKGGVVVGLVTEFLPPFMGALVFIGISAAIMSTMDSLINTASMTLIMDIYKGKASEEKRLKYSKYATLLVTCAALFISLKIRSILEIAWLASDIITTGVFVPLIGGFIWRRGNHQGATASMTGGLLYCLYNLLISFHIPLPSFWEPQSAAQVVIGMLLSLFIYVTVSLFTKEEREKAEAFIAEARKPREERGNVS